MGNCFDTEEEAKVDEAEDIRFQQWLSRNPNVRAGALLRAAFTSNIPALQDSLRTVFLDDHDKPPTERPHP